MRRIDLLEISACYPEAAEWFDTCGCEFTELESRFFERAVPDDEDARRDKERSAERIELVAVASRLKKREDGTVDNLLGREQAELRWSRTRRAWVRYSKYLRSYHDGELAPYVDLPCADEYYAIFVGSRAYLDRSGHAHTACRGLPEIGEVAEVVKMSRAKKITVARVALSMEGTALLERRGIDYVPEVEVRWSNYGRGLQSVCCDVVEQKPIRPRKR